MHFRLWLAPLAIVVSLAGGSAFGQITGGMSGSFYNPENSGTGLNIEVLSDTIAIAYWYTYDLDGDQRWHLLQGEVEGSRFIGEMYTYDGMIFGQFEPDSLNQNVFGTFQITFDGCDKLEFSYSPSAVQPDGQFYPSGRLSMQRLSSPLGVPEQCGGSKPTPSRSRVAGIYNGQSAPSGRPGVATSIIITESGEVAGISENGLYFGVASVEDNLLTGTAIAIAPAGFVFPDGDVFAIVDVDGARNGSTLTFSYQSISRTSGQTLETGSFTGTYSTLYDSGLTAGDLQGSWESELGYRFNIDITGRVTGAGAGNCRYYGTIRPIDPRFNAGTGRLLPANCAGIDGTVELTLIQEAGNLLVLASGDEFYFDIWSRR